MKLKQFRVMNFKSIEDSGDITMDEVTCLVGKNESGKTALFEALSKLNPTEGIDPHFKLEDYPRRMLNAYKKEHDKNPAVAIQVEFELNEKEMQDLTVEYGEGVFSSHNITITKGYDNNLRWNIPVVEKAYVKNLVNKADIPEDFRKKLESQESVNDLLETAKAIEDPTESIKVLIENIEKKQDKTLNDRLCDKLQNGYLPKFFYFDEYSTLPGIISLNDLKKAQAEKKYKENEYVALALIKLVGATIDEFLRQDNYERLKADLEAASNAITDQVFKFWTQNKELEVEFDLEPKFDQNRTLNETILHVRIKNRKHRVTVPFDKRSRGFVWFFSFLVAFSDYRDKEGAVILLLDEPGLNLHAKGQDDLLNFIDDGLAPHHQVIYSTESVNDFETPLVRI